MHVYLSAPALKMSGPADLSIVLVYCSSSVAVEIQYRNIFSQFYLQTTLNRIKVSLLALSTMRMQIITHKQPPNSN
jgi:hypothetical protein